MIDKQVIHVPGRYPHSNRRYFCIESLMIRRTALPSGYEVNSAAEPWAKFVESQNTYVPVLGYHVVALLRLLEQSPPRYWGACYGVKSAVWDLVNLPHMRCSSTITPETGVNLKSQDKGCRSSGSDVIRRHLPGLIALWDKLISMA
jgi:hypothetical protein